MVDVAQVVELQVVALAVAGSSPVVHPILPVMTGVAWQGDGAE